MGLTAHGFTAELIPLNVAIQLLPGFLSWKMSFGTLRFYIYHKAKNIRCVRRNMDRLTLKGPLVGTWPSMQACDLSQNPTGDLSVHSLVLSD